MVLLIIKDFLLQHLYIASFIMSFISEESLVVIAGIAGHESISIIPIIILSFFGLLIFDSLIYLISRYSIHILNFKKIKPIVAYIHKKSPGGLNKPMLYLILSKFIYGTRIATISYLSIKKMNYGRFILYELLAVGIWVLVFLTLGWLAGKEISEFAFFREGIERLLFTIIIIFVIIFILQKLIRNRLISRA